MKSEIYATCITTLLAATQLHAQTWDGGGANDFFNTASNWNPNAVPANNGTANLIFGGAARLTPNVNVNFDVSGVTFNNTAGAFNIGASGGSTLTVRGGGITNNDADTQTISAPVTFAAGSAITAAGGNLVIIGGTGLGTNTVTVSGASDTSLSSVTGTGTFVKNGAGALNFNMFTQACGVTLNAGAVNYMNSVTFSAAALTAAGGELSFASNVTLSAGSTLNVAAAATLSLPASRTITVQSASVFTYGNILATPASDIFRVTGTGSAMTTSGFALREGSSFEVLSGGKFTTNGASQVGAFGTTGSILVDGTTSSFTGTSTFHIGTGAGSNGSMTFNNGATGSFPDVSLALGLSGATNGSLTVRGGAQVTTGTVDVAHLPTSGTANVLVSGPGSQLTATFNIADLSIGATSGSTGTLTVEDGGLLDLEGPLTINETGTLNINGGLITMASGQDFTNHGTLNFTSGRFSFGDHLGIGTGTSPFGANLTLPVGKEIILPSTRTTTIGPAGSLVIDGGVFSTGTLVNSGGTLDFRRGTLRLTGSSAVSIGSGGVLGANVSVPAGSTLSLTGTASGVASSGILTVNGGDLTGGSGFTNSGSMVVESGSATFTSFSNLAGAQLIAEGNFSTSSALVNSSGARLELLGGTGRLTGGGAITNSGLLLGDGTIANPFTNTATGKIRVDTGRTLFFASTFAANAGELNLQGGTLDFTGSVTNSAGAFISGRGALYASALTNAGAMAFSGGFADIHADVTNSAGGRIATSGSGSVTTFWDDVTHNGTEIFTGTGCSTVFFGGQSGSGAFTGTGTIYFIGDLRPGSSPAAVNYAPQVVFAPSTALTLEIGGPTAGTQHDKLTFTHAATPQVEWGGTLAIALINGFVPAAGQSFDVLDFDPARDAGAFDSIALPPLPAGLAWDTAQLYTNGTLSVVTAPGLTFADWATASGIPGALPGGDHDHDGLNNATEFALGLFPPQPGIVEPEASLHLYTEGERLRLLFTRPLDRAGVTLTIQASDDLLTWTDAATSVNSATFTGPGFVSENRTHPLSDPGLVEVRDLFNTGTAPRRHMRLSITIAP